MASVKLKEECHIDVLHNRKITKCGVSHTAFLHLAKPTAAIRWIQSLNSGARENNTYEAQCGNTQRQ